MKWKCMLAASLVATAGFGVSAAQAEDSVAVIVKATTSEYWQWVFKGAEDAGKQLGGQSQKQRLPGTGHGLPQ